MKFLKAFSLLTTQRNELKIIQTGCIKFWMNKEKLTRAGFEPATSGLTCRRSTN